jgi:hypothetical protein
MLSDHNAKNTRIQQQKKHQKILLFNWRLNNMLLHDQWLIEEIREESKISWNLMRMKAQCTRTYGTL